MTSLSNGSNVILSPNGIEWAIYNNEISPYGNDTVAVQYQGPGKQLAIANKGGPVEILEKWDVGSIIEPQIIPNVTICSIPVPSECATADGMKVIANDKHTANDPNHCILKKCDTNGLKILLGDEILQIIYCFDPQGFRILDNIASKLSSLFIMYVWKIITFAIKTFVKDVNKEAIINEVY
ncbi:unnamed protein product [Rhizophagus irregularis]|nr:unnamed protein product [Rhizophagus irregularis]